MKPSQIREGNAKRYLNAEAVPMIRYPLEVTMSSVTPEPARAGHVPLVKVVVTDALDAAAVPAFRDLLDGALALRPERLVVDVANCPHIDGAAVAVLLHAHREVVRSGGHLALREVPTRLRGDPQLAEVVNEQHGVERATGTAPAGEWWSAVWAGTGAIVPRPDAAADPAGPGSGHPETVAGANREPTTTEMGQLGQWSR